MLWRLFARLSVVLALTAWLAASPLLAHAIPTTGTYDIDAATSNGLSGWFTVNPTATGLSAWQFNFGSLTWTTSDSPQTNNESRFLH